jgi:hypothetical protein
MEIKMPHQDRSVIAALSALSVLQLVMLSALYAGVPPHPPASTPLFGIAPFIGAALSVTIAAIIIGPMQGPAGRGLSVLAVILALVSFGPQKYLDAQIAQIWPAVVLAQLAVLFVLVRIFRTLSRKAGGA